MKSIVIELVVPNVGWLRVTATREGGVILVEGLDQIAPDAAHGADVRKLVHRCAVQAFAKMDAAAGDKAAPC